VLYVFVLRIHKFLLFVFVYLHIVDGDVFRYVDVADFAHTVLLACEVEPLSAFLVVDAEDAGGGLWNEGEDQKNAPIVACQPPDDVD